MSYNRAKENRKFKYNLKEKVKFDEMCYESERSINDFTWEHSEEGKGTEGRGLKMVYNIKRGGWKNKRTGMEQKQLATTATFSTWQSAETYWIMTKWAHDAILTIIGVLPIMEENFRWIYNLLINFLLT